MSPALGIIGGALALFSTSIDERHGPTACCRHIVAGELRGPAAGLAICQYPNDDGYYLFYCDADRNCVTDTWHATLDAAMAQAEFEYAGVTATWRQQDALP